MSERLRYPEEHWSRLEDPALALDQYLDMYSDAYNCTKAVLYMRLIGDVKDLRILDYGGGAGFMSVSLAKLGAKVTLVDAESGGLATAAYYAEREGVSDRLHTRQSLVVPEDLQDGGFDLVVAKDVVEHVKEDDAFIADLARCLRPGGRLLIGTQNSLSLNYAIESTIQRIRNPGHQWMGWDPTHLRFYTAASLGRQLKQVGFRVTGHASVYIIPYRILTFMTLGKIKTSIDSLKWFDLALGTLWPFNRIGWNFVLAATLTTDEQ
jgi:2-polyprenyl-6-hydroxyphenyl methylase/3-demethylubiquinone-9 3-methyltransferase